MVLGCGVTGWRERLVVLFRGAAVASLFATHPLRLAVLAWGAVGCLSSSTFEIWIVLVALGAAAGRCTLPTTTNCLSFTSCISPSISCINTYGGCPPTLFNNNHHVMLCCAVPCRTPPFCNKFIQQQPRNLNGSRSSLSQLQQPRVVVKKRQADASFQVPKSAHSTSRQVTRKWFGYSQHTCQTPNPATPLRV